MRSFSSLEAYADALAGGFSLRGRAAVAVAGVRWRRHPGHTLVEYEFDARIGYHVPVRRVRHTGCIVEDGGRVYCPRCRDFVRNEL
jgi:hypothetical protein